MQMVANGYGITLLPRVAVDVKVRDERVKLLRFSEPAPGRTVGLAGRRTSPRKVDFIALGQLITETLGLADDAACDLRRVPLHQGAQPAPREGRQNRTPR
jgi:LysR family transcriptional regulator, hydrogen peroxide-inducible genes activator